MGSTYRWKSVILWVLNTDGTLRYSTSWTSKGISESKFLTLSKNENFRTGQPGPGKVVSTKKPVEFLKYYGPTNNQRKAEAIKENLNYGILYPVIYNKEVFGVLEFTRSKPLSDSAGYRDALFTISTQIGHYIKRKQSDIKLELSEQKSKVLVELAPAIIYTLDKKGNITSLNPTVEEITGIKEEDLIGKPMTELICPEDRESAKEQLDEARKSRKVALVEASIVTKTEDNIIAEIKEKAIPTKTTNIERIGIIRDVTDRYMLERQKDLWMGIATHELKTPLSSIKAFIQILQQKSPDSEFKPYLQRINDLSDDMTTLISDLLDITKIKSGTLQLNKEYFNLNQLLENTVKAIQATTPSHKITYKTKGNPKIYADQQRIKQVVTNILTNAVKYSPEGTEIDVEMDTQNDKISLSVKDRGVGIAKKDLSQIFDLFFRSSKKDNRNVFGLGLGLFITKSIVRAHQGKIWAESETGKGSTFFVELPKNPLS